MSYPYKERTICTEAEWNDDVMDCRWSVVAYDVGVHFVYIVEERTSFNSAGPSNWEAAT